MLLGAPEPGDCRGSVDGHGLEPASPHEVGDGQRHAGLPLSTASVCRSSSTTADLLTCSRKPEAPASHSASCQDTDVDVTAEFVASRVARCRMSRMSGGPDDHQVDVGRCSTGLPSVAASARACTQDRYYCACTQHRAQHVRACTIGGSTRAPSSRLQPRTGCGFCAACCRLRTVRQARSASRRRSGPRCR